MEFIDFKAIVNNISIGKQLPDAIYVHKSAFENLPPSLSSLTQRVGDALKIPDDKWNIAKFGKRDFKITFLNYPDFDTYAYPSLHECFTVDLSKLSMRKADYSTSENPPILHRKETFVASSHPQWAAFKEVTLEGEAAGLFENTRSIGFKRNWEKLIREKGLSLDTAGRLTEKAPQPPIKLGGEGSLSEIEIQRYKTAIDRNKLSQPMQILARHEYLSGDYSVLDYGCGKGDDLRELEAHGIDACGWDPVHHPEGILINSDIVNLGFVLNVIEDKNERDETLQNAWNLAEKILVASVMIAGDSVVLQFTPYRDGVLTSRNTFQKYYSQGEFRNYLEKTLDESPIAVGQGIFLVFKDKIEEQNFLLERQHVKRDWLQRTERLPRLESTVPKQRKDFLEKNPELFMHFWETCLELGRVPANDEFELSDQVRRIAGSHAKAFGAMRNKNEGVLFDEARTKRREDLLVYFALSLFSKRKPRTQLPISLIRDIKAFFHSPDKAYDEARAALFQVGKNEVITNACVTAYQKLNHGELIEGHSYIFNKDLLGELPPELRIYIGCATQLYGDISDFHLIKAHMTSGKVSIMRYDDWNKEVPNLVERVKIKLREQDIDFFEYGAVFEPSPLPNRKCFER
ncbi:MAG: DNA phosphorothioation-associated putative methyltransferase [Pseudohongiella sp.]|nr:DNA phosphorothioation-associated putative methyltransferase [Pseudohongiella sp.]